MNTGQPPEKPTTKLSAEEIHRELLSKLLRTVEDGFARSDARFDTVEANQELQGGQVLDIGKRMTSVEERLGKVEGRQDNGSLRVREESQVNLKQDAAIAKVITKQDELAAALAANTATTEVIKNAVSGFVKEHPQLMTGLVGLVMSAIAYATAWFSAKGHP